MSYILLPRLEVFRRLPVGSPRDIFRGGVRIDGNDRAGLVEQIAKLRAAAASLTKKIPSVFNADQRRDFDARTVITVVADGATIHTDILTEQQRAFQDADRRKAFELGKSLAERGWRVALPGYSGICESVIEGVKAGNGQYVVVMEKRSLKYDAQGVPMLPENVGNGFYIVTNTLAESKSVLFALSDRSVYLPGGLNTLDMYTDNFTLEQTGSFQDYRIHGGHRRRFFVLNDDNYYQSILEMTDHMIAEGFADEHHKNIGKQLQSIEDIIEALKADLYDGAPWPALTKDTPHLFIPSQAITFAAALSRPILLRQLVATTARHLKGKLNAARSVKLKSGPIDPIAEEAITNPTAAVYCGSRGGKNPQHREMAKAVGELLRELGYTLVYGGSKFGIMGTVVNGYLAAISEFAARVLAVTPFAFLLGNGTAANEGFHDGITATIASPSMHERKMLMTTLTSGSSKEKTAPDITLMLSGGWGTLDEVLEEIRLGLMGVTEKKIIIVNTDGYWDKFPSLFEKAIERGYMRKEDLDRIQFVSSIPELRSILLADKAQNAAPKLDLQ